MFRIISNLELSLQTGGWVNTLMAHYKSGYMDAHYSADSAVVFLANPNGSLGAPTDFAGLGPRRSNESLDLYYYLGQMTNSQGYSRSGTSQLSTMS